MPTSHLTEIEILLAGVENDLNDAAERCLDARLRLRTTGISEAPRYLERAAAAVERSADNLRRAQAMVSDAIGARNMREEEGS
jgi:hypothetical protein